MRHCLASFFVGLLVVFVVATTSTDGRVNNVDDDDGDGSSSSYPSYGVDVSWPMQQQQLLSTTNNQVYQEYMQGCAEACSAELCQTNDADRISMNARQPALQTNFTSAGYAKVQAPAVAFQLLRDLWDHTPSQYYLNEHWEAGNIYTNHWKAPSQVLLLDDPDDELQGLTTAQRKVLLREVQSVLEAWTGEPLIPTSLYGVRIYREGSILAPHVDRFVSNIYNEYGRAVQEKIMDGTCVGGDDKVLPLVVSAIINVAQEAVKDDWILEVIGHDGRAVNLTMHPGEMILYESHSIIHGRPYPLKAKAYANVFVHFEPVGYTAALEERLRNRDRLSQGALQSTREKFEKALNKAHQQEIAGKQTPPKSIPSYLEEHSKEASRWRQQFVFFKDEPNQQPATKPKKGAQTQGVSQAHRLAASGDLAALQQLAKVDSSLLTSKDTNGWTPLHEAARSGHTKVIEYLIEKGSDVNARTNNGNGATPLWWAQHNLPATHPTVELLRKHGAVAIAPGE